MTTATDSKALGSRVTVQNIATYNHPITARLGERHVNIIATGDSPGNSPVCQVVDETGSISWVRLEDLRVTNPSFLPPSSETMRNIAANFNR